MGFFGLSLAWVRIIGAVAVIIALAGAWWGVAHHYEAIGRAEVQAKWDDAVNKANTEAEKKTLADQARVDIAVKERDNAIQTIDRERASAARQLGSLHNAVSAAIQTASKSQAACIERATTLGQLFEAASAEGGAMAEAADRHATDVKTLINAWPK
jgi:hypothetical protein